MNDTQITELLTQAQAAQMLNVPARSLERWRCEGTGPDFVKLGDGKRGTVRYHRRALETYIQRRTIVTNRAGKPEAR